MYDPTQLEDDDLIEISEWQRWALLLSIVVLWTAGAWALVTLFGLAWEWL